MAPVAILEYDKWGNTTLIAAQDSKGNYILYPGESWAIRRMEFNKRNYTTSVSYYDAKSNPVLCSDGYYKQTYEYDSHGNLIASSYYGTNGLPVTGNGFNYYLVNDNDPNTIGGFHKITYKYDEKTNRRIEDAFFDTKGKPVDMSYGFHRFVYKYDEDGATPVSIKCYRANGNLALSFRWNGSDWELTQQQFDWRELVAELDRECPYDLGPEAMHLTMMNIRTTGNNDCEIMFVVPYHTKSQLSLEQTDALKQMVQHITKGIEEQLNHKPYVTGNLYDKNRSLLYSFRV